ncbi:hypothetical protein CRE_14918 [Caenorhabditis remanei]|uniref:SET domain-containing protein n=1 Tax=Caenorhabditis remanei TaxID=31234 RepID=E3N7R1_CAERE|nr:hypothetical protein CRE_14918 [Caenorhabditis remanei]
MPRVKNSRVRRRKNPASPTLPDPPPQVANLPPPPPRVEITSVVPESSENDVSKWPATSSYEYIAQNCVGESLTATAKKSIEEGAKNKICCSCGPGVDCSTNERCECRRVAAELMKVYTIKKRRPKKVEKCQALTDRGLKVKPDMYYKQMFFNCGSGCTCGPSCGMKVLLKSDERQSERFFIQRRNLNIGFSVFTKEPIEEGTVVACLNGEICGERLVNTDETVAEYSMTLLDENDMLLKFISKTSRLGNRQKKYFKKIMLKKTDKKISTECISVNTAQKGNFTRFLSHCCRPNSMVLRSFQGGLSITDIRLFFIATQRIEAGEEVTIDYGAAYKKERLVNCLCGHCLSKKPRKAPRQSNQHAPQVAVEEQERGVDYQEPQNARNQAESRSTRTRKRSKPMRSSPPIQNNEDQLPRKKKRSTDTLDQN